MQIRIKDPDGPNLWIPLPTGLIFNRFTAGIAAKAASEHGGVAISPKQLRALFRAVKAYKKAHPDWVLVEVESSDGQYVRVKL